MNSLSPESVFMLYSSYFTDVVYNKIYQLSYKKYDKHVTKEKDLHEIYISLCAQYTHEILNDSASRSQARRELYLYIKDNACYVLTLDRFLYAIASYMVPENHISGLTETGVGRLFNKSLISFTTEFIGNVTSDGRLVREIVYEREEKNPTTIKNLQVMGCKILNGFKKMVGSRFEELEYEEEDTSELLSKIKELEDRIEKLATQTPTSEDFDMDATIVENKNQKKEIDELKQHIDEALMRQNKQNKEISDTADALKAQNIELKKQLEALIKANTNSNSLGPIY